MPHPDILVFTCGCGRTELRKRVTIQCRCAECKRATKNRVNLKHWRRVYGKGYSRPGRPTGAERAVGHSLPREDQP